MTGGRPRVIVSQCLLGDPVRYDGDRIDDAFVSLLCRFVECLPVCPEVGMGLGVPRPQIRIVRSAGRERLLEPATGRDLTAAIQDFTSRFLADLPAVDGVLLKGRSPSCGPHDAKVMDGMGGDTVLDWTSGFFARAIAKRWPGIPIEDEVRLDDPEIRHRYLSRVFCGWRRRGAAPEAATGTPPYPMELRHAARGGHVWTS